MASHEDDELVVYVGNSDTNSNERKKRLEIALARASVQGLVDYQIQWRTNQQLQAQQQLQAHQQLHTQQ
ncbi:hypothetical protein L917_21559 [Phytophthora nicotianae]|uniref:Uncharacterized protein n=1 Tax=Phytophthora nicotianae TaxID=4792 RepID=W2JX67_PHYNI|nr:hypothetical protein L917_21559 [Phytophthora nicotianae]